MFRLFAQLGRSRELRLLDAEMQAAGLSQALVPEAVKLTMVRLLKAEGRMDAAGCAALSDLLAFCLLGPEGHAEAMGADAAAAAERRLEAAVAAGDSLDARMVLLALHAGLVRQEVIDGFGLEVA